METVERRRKLLINIAYYVVILGLFYLFMKYAFWLFFPFLFAFLIAAIIQRPVNFLTKKTRIKKGFISGMMIMLILTVFVLLLVFVGAKAVTEIQGLVSWIGTKMDSLPELIISVRDGLVNVAKHLPDSIEAAAVNGINQLFRELAGTADKAVTEASPGGSSLLGGLLSKFDISILSKPVSGVLNTAKQIPTILVAFIISVISACFLASGYDEIVNFIKRQLSKEKRSMLSQTKAIFFSSITKLLKSYMTIICVTFVEMIIGLSVFKLIGIYNSEYMASIALVVAFVDIFPVLGTGTILIPWAIISFITGRVGLGIGLVVLYGVITVIRQIVEPKLVATNLGLPPIVTIMCMYIGLQVFGVIGIFMAPLLVTMIKVLNDQGVLHVWKTKDSEKIQTEEAENVQETEQIKES
ncbi:MAG: AI-2E family transporter [Clostridia bacterium]|nr:AI-2E family transporter [Clostridia bacterium]